SLRPAGLDEQRSRDLAYERDALQTTPESPHGVQPACGGRGVQEVEGIHADAYEAGLPQDAPGVESRERHLVRGHAEVVLGHPEMEHDRDLGVEDGGLGEDDAASGLEHAVGLPERGEKIEMMEHGAAVDGVELAVGKRHALRIAAEDPYVVARRDTPPRVGQQVDGEIDPAEGDAALRDLVEEDPGAAPQLEGEASSCEAGELHEQLGPSAGPPPSGRGIPVPGRVRAGGDAAVML